MIKQVSAVAFWSNVEEVARQPCLNAFWKCMLKAIRHFIYVQVLHLHFKKCLTQSWGEILVACLINMQLIFHFLKNELDIVSIC